MSILSTVIIGFFVGLIAKFFMPGRDPSGCLVTTLLGIGGAVVGKYIGQGLGLYTPEQTAGFFMSIVGAMVLLFVYHLLNKHNA